MGSSSWGRLSGPLHLFVPGVWQEGLGVNHPQPWVGNSPPPPPAPGSWSCSWLKPRGWGKSGLHCRGQISMNNCKIGRKWGLRPQHAPMISDLFWLRIALHRRASALRSLMVPLSIFGPSHCLPFCPFFAAVAPLAAFGLLKAILASFGSLWPLSTAFGQFEPF